MADVIVDVLGENAVAEAVEEVRDLGGAAEDAAETAESARDAAIAAASAVQASAAAIDAVKAWQGKENGWPDSFFRRTDFRTGTRNGHTVWWDLNGAESWAGMKYVANSVYDGRAIRKTGNSGLVGPRIWIADAGWKVGDTVSISIVVKAGPNGVGAQFRHFIRAYSATGGALGSQVAGVDASGNNFPVLSATPIVMTATMTIPASTAFIHLYPLLNSVGADADIVALWATRSSAHPALPPATEDVSDRMLSAEDDLAVLDAVNDYAFITRTVLGGSSTIALDGSSFATIASDIPFTGYGEAFTPAGVSFNAVEIVSLGRTPSATVLWRSIHVVIRTGATPQSAGAPIVAVGSVLVDPEADTLSAVKVMLRDPLTNAPVTLSDASFDTQYFIGVYARTAEGEGAACGIPGGAFANSVGQSYYITNRDPLAETWSTNTGNQRVGVRHLLVTNPVETIEAEPRQGFAYDVAEKMSISLTPPEIVLPPIVYGVAARECNVYFDNMLVEDVAAYHVNVVSNYGAQLDECWRWTPSGVLASSTLQIVLHDRKQGIQLSDKTVTIKAAAAAAGSGVNRKVMVIGDSLVEAGTITGTLDGLQDADLFKLTFYGSRGSGDNVYEGRGGYTIDDYTTAGRSYQAFTVSGVSVAPTPGSTKYSNNGSVFTVQEVNLSGGGGTLVCSLDSGSGPSASGTLTLTSGTGDASIAFSATAAASGNPFWIGGALDFQQYLTNKGYPDLDWVLIALGINGTFGYTDDAAVISYIDAELIKLDALIASIKAADAGTKVGLVIPPPPSAYQSAFGGDYATGQTRWRHKRNIALFARQMIAKYAGQEANRIYLVPSNTAIDTVHGFPTTEVAANSRTAATVTRGTNGVHPATSGYQQIADAWWAFLKVQA